MASVYGWTGKILKVDLSTGRTKHVDTMQYVPSYMGGLGVAARMAWEELAPGTDAFDPENMLFVMTGPLTGTLASGAGRVEVAGIAPQQRPSVYSRSGMGGHWGAELKYAGYDGVVVVGQAEEPVYLWIDNEKVEIRKADEVWGMGTFATTKHLRAEHGPKTRVISCGQAGEGLSRIAVIQTETGNAAGQGGYGAVMGSKKLKAIAVRGTGAVELARPQEFLELCLRSSREDGRPNDPTAHGAESGPRSSPHFRTRKCGFCATPCTHAIYFGTANAPMAGTHSVARQCWGYHTNVRGESLPARAITSDYGLNGWEISFGIIPWLQLCRQHGLIETVGGVEIPIPDQPINYLKDTVGVSPEFLGALVEIIARREGELGDALADGSCYAAERLFDGQGLPLLDHIYPRRAGQTEHWAGHWGPGGTVYWPWWLPPILQWATDTRDPANDSTHQWTSHAQHYLPESGPNRGPFPVDKVRAICAKVYGNPDVGNPAFEYEPYEAKAIPAIWHSDRGMIVDSMVLCDYENTRVFSMQSEDGAADTALMAKLFSAATGCETRERELDQAGERVSNLHRAIDIRNHGRDRSIDESTFDNLMYPGKDDGITPDRDQLVALLQTYYRLRGWNPANGWPTRVKLEELDLRDVADELEGLGRLG